MDYYPTSLKLWKFDDEREYPENVVENLSYTVVVPFFNFPKLNSEFAKCVEQGITLGIKFVLVCSPGDDTWKELSQETKNVRVIFTGSDNPGKARNEGLEFVETDWISFWDADDKPEVDEFLELLRKTVLARREIGAGGFTITSDDSRSVLVPLPENRARIAEIAVLTFPGLWRFVFRCDVINGLKFPALSMGEDQIFLGQVIQKIEHVFIYPRSIYQYRQNPNQLTQNPSRRSEVNSAIEEMIRLRFSYTGKHLSFPNKVFLRNVVTALKINKRLEFSVQLELIKLLLLHPLATTFTLIRIFLFSQGIER